MFVQVAAVSPVWYRSQSRPLDHVSASRVRTDLALYVLWRFMCWAFGRGVSGACCLAGYGCGCWLVMGVGAARRVTPGMGKPTHHVRERGRCAAADYTTPSLHPRETRNRHCTCTYVRHRGVRDEPAAGGAGGAEHHGVTRRCHTYLSGARATARSVSCRWVIFTPLVPYSPDMLCGPQTVT